MGATALVLQDIGERFPPALAPALGRLGLPTVSLDLSCTAPGIDVVLRDEAHGAALAAEYLIERGHRAIGWYGPLTSSYNGRRRFAGAAEVLLKEGMPSITRDWQDTEPAIDVRLAREHLDRPDRPRAVLALWQTAATALARAAQDLGLNLGEDLDIVGWSLEEHFDEGYAAECPQLRRNCATITWSMADVGRTILSRIDERRRNPDLPDARIMLPMRLREPAAPRNSQE
jgi:DNA-binding LacI/PurR family transcriptional regulator